MSDQDKPPNENPKKNVKKKSSTTRTRLEHSTQKYLNDNRVWKKSQIPVLSNQFHETNYPANDIHHGYLKELSKDELLKLNKVLLQKIGMLKTRIDTQEREIKSQSHLIGLMYQTENKHNEEKGKRCPRAKKELKRKCGKNCRCGKKNVIVQQDPSLAPPINIEQMGANDED